MSFEKLVMALTGVFVVLILAFLVIRFAPKRTRKSTFQSKWKEIYKYCAHKETWPTALLRADELLDRALKHRRHKGKNVGERLVAAQKVFSDNDGLWLAHKLAVKAKNQPKLRLKEKDVKKALTSFRQGLKDLDVL